MRGIEAGTASLPALPLVIAKLQKLSEKLFAQAR
jgi:hypothetical protein